MNRISVSLVMVISLILASCGLVTPPNSSGGSPPAAVVSSVAEAAMIKATQALNTAENAYAIAAYSAAAAVRSGVVSASVGPRIRAVNKTANEVLDKAHNARSAAERLRHVGLLESLTGELNFLKGDTS
jgi:folylpolyglutamate synthase/dihydropteroate synthase